MNGCVPYLSLSVHMYCLEEKRENRAFPAHRGLEGTRRGEKTRGQERGGG